MSILAFQMPEKVTMEKADDFHEVIRASLLVEASNASGSTVKLKACILMLLLP